MAIYTRLGRILIHDMIRFGSGTSIRHVVGVGRTTFALILPELWPGSITQICPRISRGIVPTQ